MPVLLFGAGAIAGFFGTKGVEKTSDTLKWAAMAAVGYIIWKVAK